MSVSRRVTVQAPGKVNIHLAVGIRRTDGYHDLATMLQAVSIWDELTVEAADHLRVTVAGPEASLLPDCRSNLAARAAVMIAARAGRAPSVRIHVRKALPVAGGMAGGSADAAATLLACNALWNAGLTAAELLELALCLGSDVPFMLTGDTAIGRGRGELLTPMAPCAELHWVFAFQHRGLATARVYAEFDRFPTARPARRVAVPEELCRAVESGAPGHVARLMRNDLEDSALRMRPHLCRVLGAGTDLGACGAIVCGTGATCAFLVSDRESGIVLAEALNASGVCRQACYASGPVPGPKVVAAH